MLIVIPGEPKGKARPKAQKRGNYIHIYTPQKSLDYENYVKYCFSNSNINHKPYLEEETLKATFRIFQAIPKSTSKKKAHEMRRGTIRPTKKPDLDNIIKIVLDSLNGLAYKDDTQIIEIVASKYYSDSPRVELEIIEMTPKPLENYPINDNERNLFNI